MKATKETSLTVARPATQQQEQQEGTGEAVTWHGHDWRLVAVEQDSFGRVAMFQCRCGSAHFTDAA